MSIEDDVTANGLQLVKKGDHWMFNDASTGYRTLDYWPSTGKYWSASAQRGGIVGLEGVVAVAVEFRDGDVIASNFMKRFLENVKKGGKRRIRRK